jgi:hypothetical protein
MITVTYLVRTLGRIAKGLEMNANDCENCEQACSELRELTEKIEREYNRLQGSEP